ncbi:MAG: hypothetical protein JST85_24585 [Acidobacteria bacterium]|nr:hypothetical protein [Acidobacteriota bacterium]
MRRKLFLSVLIVCALIQTARLQERPQPNPAPETQQATQPAPAQTPPKPVETSLTVEQFAALSQKLSEPNGYFDTDNLISNETSYLHIMGKMRQMKINGGAFIGVGPDQSFSYIAQIRPNIAFMVDIRHDNLLQHLLFKALFESARNRIEYLCLFFGKPVPADLKSWDARNIQDIVAYIDKTPKDTKLFDATHAALRAKIKSYGIKISDSEIETIKRMHTEFFTSGLDLKFTSHGRGSRYYYPNYRDLLLEKDLTGKQCNYLVSEDDFRSLKSLQERNLVIPVTGNLAGDHALKSIAAYLNERREKVSAFYTSNVEFYLMRGDDFDHFAANVKALPRDANSLIIRSYFNGTWGYAHPQSVSGYYSTQLLQTMDSFVKEYAAGGLQSYSDVISKHSLDLR